MARCYPLITVLIAVTLLLAACGGQPAEPVVAEQASSECEEGFRLFDHDLLATDPVCNPQRPVILSWAAAEMAFALDLQPVATYLVPASIEALPALQGRIGDTPVLDWQFSLEQIVNLDPDIILASYHEDMLDQLSAIAPTILFDWTGSEQWKEEMRFWGEVLGISADVDALLADYEARVSAFQTSMGDRLDSETISITRIYPEGPSLYLINSWAGAIAQEAGLSRPEYQGNSPEEVAELFRDNSQAKISNEELRLVDADHILIWTLSDDEAIQTRDELLASPLWQQLEAVKQGHVYIAGAYWIVDGIFSAHAALDDLFRYVADVDLAAVSPNPFLSEEPSN